MSMQKVAPEGFKQPLKLWQWKGVVDKKAHRGMLWKVFGSEQFLRGMWEYFTLERKIPADAVQENKKESKVSGNRSLFSKKFWNK